MQKQLHPRIRDISINEQNPVFWSVAGTDQLRHTLPVSPVYGGGVGFSHFQLADGRLHLDYMTHGAHLPLSLHTTNDAMDVVSFAWHVPSAGKAPESTQGPFDKVPGHARAVGLANQHQFLLARVRGISHRNATVDVSAILPILKDFEHTASNDGARKHSSRCSH